MLAALIILGVVAGIAWPYLKGHRALPWRGRNAMVAVAAAAEEDPEEAHFREARGELCPHCSKLNAAGKVICVDCGGKMAVDNVSSLFQDTDREELMREGIQVGLLFLGMLLAVALASWLPMAGKLVVVMATFALLSYRFLHAISD